VSEQVNICSLRCGLRHGGLNAKGVDGTPIDVMGEGRMDFELREGNLWGPLSVY
jgi:hypothetical protein